MAASAESEDAERNQPALCIIAIELDHSNTSFSPPDQSYHNMLRWLTGSSSRRPALLKLRSSKTFIIITISTAVFTDIFVYGIVVPVLPFALTERSNVDSGSVQTWISIFLAVYGAALLFASPICGWFADRSSSRRMPLMLGLLALGGSTAMLCVGDSIGILAAGRVLQGISAAVVWVVGLALLVDTVGPDGIGQAMGYVGMSMSLAILVAPLLGGVVFDLAGYYAVFAMAFGLIALDIVLRLVMIEKKSAAKWLSPTEVDESLPSSNENEKTTHAIDRQNDQEAGLDAETGPLEQSHTAINDGRLSDSPQCPLFGLTQTVVLTPMMAEITYAVDAKAQTRPPGFFGKNGAYAQAYSLFNMAWAAGSMVGPLLAGLVKQRAGWGVTTMILGIVSIVTAIPAVIWTGGSIRKELGRKRESRN
ncbi:hypothetical protein D0859_08350 [Hortaea werneckii]|uniref:Major facilitator superfamily (MFS) profile domain-containing protein n=1 Tax=Hortaea werneckii TaxID=91943 RepID=A0A3M7IPZ5_HORWE|nr:hypothetical protein D0859_08350 [Hortaea werneckii]